jgi:predicted S18 family serine protease
MTGTINSGNLIGPVAGVPAKALAAQEIGYTRVLIPEWDVVNNTPDENLTIDVVPIVTLEEALYYFTGKNYSQAIELTGTIRSEEYDTMMYQITSDLCTKYGKKSGDELLLPNLTTYGYNITNITQDNFKLASNAINNNSYYSAASFCFGGNVKVTHALIKNLTNDKLKLIYAELLTNVTDFKNDLENISESLSTISQLETYMIVAERIFESKNILSGMNPENISAYELAYAVERYNTAVVWSRFYDMSGQKFVMDTDFLRSACSKKLSEAEERLNYLEIYYPDDTIREDLVKAYEYYAQKDYALCIFTASKVKADSDIVLSAIFVPDSDTERLFDEKSAAARRVIIKQKNANIFPILGYSYYEYAQTLRNTDKYSALLYAEYSLELSNLDMYFKKRDALMLSVPPSVERINFYLFTLGVSVGIIVSVSVFFAIFYFRFKKPQRKSSKK